MFADGGGNDSGGGGGNVGGGGGGNESGWGNNNNIEFGDDDDSSRGKNNNHCSKCCLIFSGVCGIIVALGLIIGGAAVLSTSIDRSNTYAETTGTIVDLRSCGCSNSDGGRCSETFAAIVEYTVDDTDYTIELSSCSNPAPKVGNDIRVLYDPDVPEEGVNGSWIGLYLLPTILLVIGIPCFCGIAVACCIASRSKFLGNDKPVEVNGAVTKIG